LPAAESIVSMRQIQSQSSSCKAERFS
jgi:hypothetical protein